MMPLFFRRFFDILVNFLCIQIVERSAFVMLVSLFWRKKKSKDPVAGAVKRYDKDRGSAATLLRHSAGSVTQVQEKHHASNY